MRNFKKVVAAGLALLMLALSVNVTFAAEEYTDKEAVVVAKVNAAGIMTGTDKGFEPSKTLTRAEAAAIMVRMKGITEDTVKQNAGTTLFTDVAASHWAAGYINVASNYGLIKGVGANKFAPEKEVTVAEFYTMAIRALGAGQLVEAEGTWPTNYVNFAIENDLAEDVAQIYTAAATRMSAATIVANTLKAKMWVKGAVKSNGEITWTESDKTILFNTLNIIEIPNVKISEVKVKDAKANFEADAIWKIDNVTYDWTAVGGKQLDVAENVNITTSKAGEKYTVWYDKSEKEVVGFWIPTETDSIVFTDIKSFADGKIKLKVDGEEKKFDTTATKLYLNGASTLSSFTAGVLPTSGVAYYGKDTDSNKIVSIYAENFADYGVIKEIKNNKIYFEDAATVVGATQVNTITLKLKDSDDNIYNVTKDGKTIDVTELEEGDAIYTHTVGDVTTIKVINDTVEGKVKSVSDKKLSIDGTSYDTYANGLADLKDEGTFYLYEGKVVMFKADEATNGDFALVSASRTGVPSYVGDEAKVELKLSTIDGNMTDWTELDAKKSADNLAEELVTVVTVTDANLTTVNNDRDGDAFVVTDKAYLYGTKHYHSMDDAKAAIKAACKALSLGTIVSYEMKSGKIVLTKHFVEDNQVRRVSSFKDASVDYVLTIDESDTTKEDTTKYFLNSKTVVAEIVDNEEDGSDRELSLKILDAEDIDTIAMTKTGSTVNAIAQFADLNDKQNEIGLIVFYEGKSEVKTEKKWAFVKEVKSYADDDNDDIAYQYKVIYQGETSETTLFTKSSCTGLTCSTTDQGKVFELAVDSNDMITKASVKDLNEELTRLTISTPAYLYKEYANGTYTFANPTVNATSHKIEAIGETERYIISEDVIVIGIEDGKYKVKDISNIDELVDKVDETITAGTDTIAKIYREKVDTDEYEIVAIVFNVVDDEQN